MASCESNVAYDESAVNEIAEPVEPLADKAVDPALIGELASTTTEAAWLIGAYKTTKRWAAASVVPVLSVLSNVLLAAKACDSVEYQTVLFTS